MSYLAIAAVGVTLVLLGAGLVAAWRHSSRVDRTFAEIVSRWDD